MSEELEIQLGGYKRLVEASVRQKTERDALRESARSKLTKEEARAVGLYQ